MHATRAFSICFTYEVRFDLTDTLFCLTKYELVRTTKFTRLVLPILYVKRLVVVNQYFNTNIPFVFEEFWACPNCVIMCECANNYLSVIDSQPTSEALARVRRPYPRHCQQLWTWHIYVGSISSFDYHAFRSDPNIHVEPASDYVAGVIIRRETANKEVWGSGCVVHTKSRREKELNTRQVLCAVVSNSNDCDESHSLYTSYNGWWASSTWE